VFKNITIQYARHAVAQIDLLEDLLKQGFQSARHAIDSWAGLPESGKTIGEHQEKDGTGSAIASPQNNWALYHMSNGIGGSKASGQRPDPEDSALLKLFRTLETAVVNEVEEIKRAVQESRAEVADKITALSPEQVIQNILGIVAKFVVNTTENLALRLLDIVRIIMDGLLDLLEAPLEIPVISWVYENVITNGDKLSFLDVVCLIAAIPATVIFKVVTNRTPFPDDKQTQALIDTPNFATLTNLLSKGEQSSTLATGEVTIAGAKTPGKIVALSLKLITFFTSKGNVILQSAKRSGLDGKSTSVRITSIALWLLHAIPGVSSN
jgi:hypothetical protein